MTSWTVAYWFRGEGHNPHEEEGEDEGEGEGDVEAGVVEPHTRCDGRRVCESDEWGGGWVARDAAGGRGPCAGVATRRVGWGVGCCVDGSVL